MEFDLTSFLKNLTKQPGIYQMLNAFGDVIYVGKAKNLKNRVNSYFAKSDGSLKTQHMLKQVAKIEVIVTASENEALLLESNLIKKLRPKYNVLLRDDKSYPYIYISTEHDFPRIDLYRGKKKSKGKYFGPYPSSGAVRETLNLLQKLFRIRQCRDTFFKNRTRPCLQYQIKRCTAPCVDYINKVDYGESIRHAILFLEGKNQKIIDDYVQKMEAASIDLHYELAAYYRDLIGALRKVQEQQYVTKEGGNIDVIVVFAQIGGVCVQVMTIRGGRIIGNKSFYPKIPKDAENTEVLESFVAQYYLNPARIQEIPQEVILNQAIIDQAWLSDALTEQRQTQVVINHNVRGKRAKWIKMALLNAKVALTSHLSQAANIYQRFEALQNVLHLESLPQRLECFDISHSSGEATQASCVVFDQSGPVKADYRRYNIKGITPGDDYAAMHQALLRRYKKIKTGEGKLPDILFVDGGKGQLHQAAKVLEELQVIGVTLVGIAKGPGRKPEYDRLFLADNTEALNVKHDSLALHLVQQIRDEAHRFAITGHRHKRDKKRTTSPLEAIEGVGAKRRQQLLARFGGLQELKAASLDEIAKIPGVSKVLAQRIYEALHEE